METNTNNINTNDDNIIAVIDGQFMRRNLEDAQEILKDGEKMEHILLAHLIKSISVIGIK